MFHTSVHNIFMENKQTELVVKINENYFRSNTQKNNLWRIVYVFEKVHEQIGQILFKNFLVQATYEGEEQRIEELKEEVRNELKASAGKSTELLKLINSIQLLGLAYHFEKEIEEALKDMHGKYDLVDDNENLTNASLRFRLLRQEGHLISSGKSSPLPYLTKITCHLEFSYYCYNGYIY